MGSVIIYAMLVGFFTGGNLAIAAKDVKYKGAVDPINVIGLCCGVVSMITITTRALS